MNSDIFDKKMLLIKNEMTIRILTNWIQIIQMLHKKRSIAITMQNCQSDQEHLGMNRINLLQKALEWIQEVGLMALLLRPQIKMSWSRTWYQSKLWKSVKKAKQCDPQNKKMTFKKIKIKMYLNHNILR